MEPERQEYARALGIKIDGRWSAERLDAEIAKAEDAATAPAPVAKSGGVMVRVLRDYWTSELDDDGLNKRVKAGTVLEVDPMRALDMVEAGAVERVR